ncbi:MAG TPA: UvrD-helicase domain-containing protein [Candidatus Limnocylindria bacterium]|nr:UvrD-helicase domain-containing protein [Candidatus Limnocylindria bacterium]
MLRRPVLNLATLNPQQREAVITHRGPVLILAGAGTGKTRVITHRIAHMAQKGVPPGNILAVTFTNKAAREMLQRVNELVPKVRKADRWAQTEGDEPPRAEERPTICTFHSLCVRILRQHIEKIGYKRNFVIYDEGDQLAAMKKILSAISAKGENTDPKVILAMLSKFKNGGTRAAGFEDPGVRALAEHVAKRYESALHACNAVDFDDLILLTLRLFREHPDALQACCDRFRYVMVDEYQDTNAAQFELVHSLTRESRNLCVVGDDDQSIYGWRGAEVANLLDLEKHFPEVKVIKLEQNYRSTNHILNAANAVIKNNARRRGKNLWSSQGDGEKLILQCFANDDEEARVVAENIEYDRLAKRVPWGQQAILFRTNMQSRPLETALRKAKIRYHLIGGQSYFDRREIRDFLAYLRTFLNPHDDVALLRIANTPARGLSDVTMERVLEASHERRCSVFATMRHTDVQAGFQSRAGEAMREFLRFIEETRAPLEANEPFSLGQWAENWLNRTGYLAELQRMEKTPEAAENRIKNLKELILTLDDKEQPNARPQARLDEFLADLTLDHEREEDKEAGDAVTLITVHAAKGLEYPRVHLVGLEDGLMPHSRSKVEGTMDEERRLFYVAITRARETLRISHCSGRKKYGQLLPCHPSPFLKELPADCYVDAEVAASKPVEKESGGDWFAAMRAALD